MKRLHHLSQLEDIIQASAAKPQMIFKHSTRCSISAAAKHRLETALSQLKESMDIHFLDLLLHRDISQAIAERFGVRHESPQILMVHHGSVDFHMSHYDIEPGIILQKVSLFEPSPSSNPS
jgi:bacillithiol system protein YtxJ